MNKPLIENLAKQALVAANGIAEICCETDEERDYFWKCIVENAGSTKETVPEIILEDPKMCYHLNRDIDRDNMRYICCDCGSYLKYDIVTDTWNIARD